MLSNRISIRGADIAWTDEGQGPALLLIHGFPLDRTMWAGQVAGLRDVCRVIAPDLRGFGESAAPAGEYTMDTFADDLAALLDHLAVDRAVVGGLSMGGYVALAFWRRHAARVRGLILANTRAAADTEAARQNRYRLIEQVDSQGPGVVIEQMLPKLLAPETYRDQPALVEDVRAMMARASARGITGALRGMAARPDSRDLLPGITSPALVLHGAADAIIPVGEAEDMRATLPQASLVVLPGAGHMAPLEQPQAANAAIRAFFGQLDG